MGSFSYNKKLQGRRQFIRSKVMPGLFGTIGASVDSIANIFLPRERAKAIRHAEKAGVKTPEEFEQHLKDKHGAKAAAKGMEVSDYLKEQQARGKEKYGKGGKTQANRGDSTDSSEDSEG